VVTDRRLPGSRPGDCQSNIGNSNIGKIGEEAHFMGVFKRFAAIVRAKVNKLLDRAEDPRDTLDFSYTQQMQNLQKLRRSVAEVATARKRIEIQAQQLQQQASKLQGQARAALSLQKEDLAREALSRRAAIGAELSELETQHSQVQEQEKRLIQTMQRVQTQVEAFRTRKETLKASYTAAEAQTRVGEAVSGISDSMGDAGMVMQRAQDKISAMQARAGAIDDLLASGSLTDLTTGRDDIQARLDKVASQGQVEAELASLRNELAASSAEALGAGQTAARTETPASQQPERVQPAATTSADPESGVDP
jgi:phage shock protein A